MAADLLVARADLQADGAPAAHDHPERLEPPAPLAAKRLDPLQQQFLQRGEAAVEHMQPAARQREGARLGDQSDVARPEGRGERCRRGGHRAERMVGRQRSQRVVPGAGQQRLQPTELPALPEASGRERHRRRQDRLRHPAEGVQPLDRGGQRRRRRAERPRELLVAGGCISPEVEPLLSDQEPDERRGERPPLDHRHAVQLLEDAHRLRIVERRQQRRRTRERRAARVERRLLGLVGDDQHPEATPRQQRRRDEARRLPSTDDHVVEVRVDHGTRSYRLRNGAFPGADPRTRTRRPSTTTRRSAIARTTAGSRRCSSARMRARSASSSSSS